MLIHFSYKKGPNYNELFKHIYNLTSIVKHENPVKRITMLKFIVLCEVTHYSAVQWQVSKPSVELADI